MVTTTKFRYSLHSTMSNYSTLILLLLAIIISIGTNVDSAKLEVPFQDFATPGPTISSKIYYITESCTICEKFRPDFTRVKKPPEPEPEPESESKSVIDDTTTTIEAENVKETDKTEKDTLKRVPRQATSASSFASKLKSDDKDIILLDYNKQSANDSDVQEDGSWSWKRAFKKIHAKWIERFQNNTATKIDQAMTAKIKVEKTPEGDEKKKFVLEFKKKIQNLTSLNTIVDDDEPVNAPDVEETMKEEDEQEKVLVKRELKQIFLDPVKQPSIVIRAKRSAILMNDTTDDAVGDETNTDNPMFEMSTLPTQVFDENDTVLNETNAEKNGTYAKCRLLIRFKANPENATEESSDDFDSEVDIDSNKNQTLLEPVEESESLPEKDKSTLVVEEKGKEIESEKKSNIFKDEKEPEKTSLAESDEKVMIPAEPKETESIENEVLKTTKEEESIVAITSSPSPKEEKPMIAAVEYVKEQKPILTIADDEKSSVTKEKTSSEKEIQESSSPSSVSSEKEVQNATPKPPSSEKSEKEESKVVDKVQESSSISTSKVGAKESSKKETSTKKPKKSKPSNAELGLMINIRKFVGGM